MAEKGTRKNTGKKTPAKRGRPKKKKEVDGRKVILTEKQEAFLYYLVYEGLSQREAYRKSHPDCTQKDAYVDSKASNELKKDKVRARYKVMLDDVRRRRYHNAATKAPLVENELYQIAMGTKKYIAYDMYGKEQERYPTVPQRTKALAELNKIYNEIMNKEEYEGGEEDGKQVIINIAPFESKGQ